MQKRNNVSTMLQLLGAYRNKFVQCLRWYLYTKTGKCLSIQIRLPPEVNRVLYIRNLPYKITSDEMYDIFGKYGAIRQIRV